MGEAVSRDSAQQAISGFQILSLFCFLPKWEDEFIVDPPETHLGDYRQ
jgi:hypothetical protein